MAPSQHPCQQLLSSVAQCLHFFQQIAKADIERIKNISVTVELAELGKQAYVNKYLKVEKTFAKYFANIWQKKKWTYAEVNALLESENPRDYHPACNPPQSNSIERQNRTQKEVYTRSRGGGDGSWHRNRVRTSSRSLVSG